MLQIELDAWLQYRPTSMLTGRVLDRKFIDSGKGTLKTQEWKNREWKTRESRSLVSLFFLRSDALMAVLQILDLVR